MTSPADDAPMRPLRRRRRRWWIAGGAVGALAVALWAGRTPIADSLLRDQFDQRGIAARYTIEKIGLGRQRLTDIVIGDPARPDLTARALDVTIGYGLSGPYVAAVRADGVRLYGRVVDGRLSFGSLDRFRNPEDKTPFALPDLAASLRDARARVETPWGAVGAVLNGSGNLRRDFSGRLALVAPRVDVAGCAARDVSFYGTLAVRNVRPRLTGPLRGGGVVCAGGAATAPQVALDIAFAEDLMRWDGSADAAVARVTAGSMRADRLGIKARFAGTIDRSDVKIDTQTASLRGGGFSATGVRFDGRGTIGSADPALEGRVRFASASADSALRRKIAAGGRGLASSPVGPLADRATAAFAAMLAGMRGEAGLALTGQGQALRIELIGPRIDSASGARFTGSADSRIGYLFAAAEPAVIATGSWHFGGGAMPSGSLTIDRRKDGSVAGLARFDAYAAPGARLALAPIRFSGVRGGPIRFATVAELSGPLGEGRVEGLRAPLSGALSPTGAFALDGGCRRIAARQVDVSGFRLVGNAIDLCSRPGAPLLSADRSGLRGGFRIPALRLRGSSGAAPLAVDAGAGSLDLASWRWSLADAKIRLGEGEGATHFGAASMTGAAADGGMAGTLTAASAKIGAVPLDMTEIAGDWRWAKGALTLEGGLLLTDADPDPRFAPLISRDARLRFADGAIEAAAGFSERKTGTKILDTAIRHRLGDSVGSADLVVLDLRFGDAFQPDQLSRLALGVVANVQGSVAGTGRIDWDAAGVTSSGTFATKGADLAAAFGPVTGLSATLHFDDLLGLRSAPGQTVTLAEVNPGIPVRDGQLEYRLLGDNRVRIEGGRWPFAGGELVLHPTTIDFNADKPRRLIFDLVGINAAIFLQQFEFENINASGLFDGSLPVEFDGLGGRIVGGRIDARGAGTLAYVGELSNHNLGTMANFAFGALRSLKYDDLTIVLNGNLDGEMVTDIRFGGVGQGEGATRNFLTRQIARIPLVFNVKVQAPFRQLITSAKGFYDPSILIEQNLPALLRVQAERDDTKKEGPMPVQPSESEPVR